MDVCSQKAEVNAFASNAQDLSAFSTSKTEQSAASACALTEAQLQYKDLSKSCSTL